MDPKAQARLDVDAFLNLNKNWLQGMSVDFMFVPQAAAQLLPSELRSVVAVWRGLNGADFSSAVTIPPATPPLPAPPDGKLIESVKKLITTVTDDVDVTGWRRRPACLLVSSSR
jgi:hypothetical protein